MLVLIQKGEQQIDSNICMSFSGFFIKSVQVQDLHSSFGLPNRPQCIELFLLFKFIQFTFAKFALKLQLISLFSCANSFRMRRHICIYIFYSEFSL